MGRVVVAGYPHHVVQRGHNRQIVFAATHDYRSYLESLRELKSRFEVAVHAFCLMTNHVHLLLTPRDRCGLASLMKHLAGRHTRRHNSLEGRTGTLWEGRYRSSVVDRDDYLLACSRYIELNPLRARLVSKPQDYPWSSCRFRLGDPGCDWLDLDVAYRGLADNEKDRRVRYGALIKAAVPTAETDLIRKALQRGQLTGTDRFSDEIAEILGRRIERRGPGRPSRK